MTRSGDPEVAPEIQGGMDVTGHDPAETMQKERRRRKEMAMSQALDDIDTLLLPLALSIARLAARLQFRHNAENRQRSSNEFGGRPAAKFDGAARRGCSKASAVGEIG